MPFFTRSKLCSLMKRSGRLINIAMSWNRAESNSFGTQWFHGVFQHGDAMNR